MKINLNYPEKIYYNKEINLSKLTEEKSDKLISPVFNDDYLEIFDSGIAYHLYRQKRFPVKKYKIEILNYIFGQLPQAKA